MEYDKVPPPPCVVIYTCKRSIHPGWNLDFRISGLNDNIAMGFWSNPYTYISLPYYDGYPLERGPVYYAEYYYIIINFLSREKFDIYIYDNQNGKWINTKNYYNLNNPFKNSTKQLYLFRDGINYSTISRFVTYTNKNKIFIDSNEEIFEI